MNVELVNVVAGGDLSSPLDLHTLSSRLSHYAPNYEPEVAPGLYFELPEAAVTVMVFSSGKYHLTGGNSIEQVHEANAELIDIFEFDLGTEVNPSKLEIRNLVYRGEFDREFDLEVLADDIRDCDYDPEVYPGLYYSKDGAQMTIYRTGKFTVTGATGRKEVEDLIETFQLDITS